MADDKTYMAEVLEWALRYAAVGFEVFPSHAPVGNGCTCGEDCGRNRGKHPRTTHGFLDASRDARQIHKWFGPDAPLSNVAIRTGEVSGLTVIDIDGGEGKVGLNNWLELTREKGDLSGITLTAETPGGGYHVGFGYNSVLKNGTNVLAEHIDGRNDGGYIIAAPSRHKSGGQYKWMNWGAKLLPLPAHLTKKKETRGRSRKDDPLRRRYSLEEVLAILEHVPADDRDLWRAVGIIMGREFNRSDSAWAGYNAWAEKDTRPKGRNHDAIMREAFYELSQQDTERELTLGTIIKAAQDNGWIPNDVLEMNKQYAVVWMGGDCVILREHLAPDTGLLEVSFCTKAALNLFHANDAKANPVERWLKHPERRTYHGLVFAPGRASCNPSLYNLWQGFAVEPKQGDCSLYLAHLRDNICRGNKEIFLYLMAWMANIVQTPGNRPGVAIVLRGKQGTGKGIFAKGFGGLLTPHFAHITNSHQLVGRFNALLQKAVLVFADEAFWAGDKQAEGTLNALITEETHNIEPKGIDPFSVRNFMHLIIASNHEWVIPAASEARRWLVLDVNEARLQDHAYFKAIDTQMKKGGREALLYQLLHYDGSGVDLWTVPKTAALEDQKVHSMTPVEKFWFGCLEAGSQIGGRREWDEGIYANDKGWQTQIRSAELYDAYIARSQQAGVKRRAMEMELADALKRMVPGAEHKSMTFGQDQARGWKFPPLAECRKAFDEYMKWTFEWEHEPQVVQPGLYEQGLYDQKDDLGYVGAEVVPLQMDS